MGETASKTAVSGGANFFNRKSKSLLWFREIGFFSSFPLPLTCWEEQKRLEVKEDEA